MHISFILMNSSNTDCNYELVIRNKRVWDFFQDHPGISFENANILMIEFLDSIINNISKDADKNINAQILSYLSENKIRLDSIEHNLSSVQDNVSKMNTDMPNQLMLQFANLKKEYIEDVKQLVSTNSLTMNEKISAILDKNNEHLIDKTTIILNDAIPKSQTGIVNNMQDQFKQLHQVIINDLSKIDSAKNNEILLQNYLGSIETKYAALLQNIQQPLFSFFTASEDRLSKNMDVIKETSTQTFLSQKPILDGLSEFLGKYSNSSNKGKYGEQNLASLLNSIYPNAEIKETTGQKAAGDFTLRRLDKPSIVFENKEYKNNIDKEEVSKFIRDIDVQKMHGIFISQYSGIAFKQNYQIDIHRGNILVYVQNCEYSADKIRIAVDIIDMLSNKIGELNLNDDENNKISKEILDDINSEYQAFINQKENMLISIKDNYKRMITHVEDLKFPSLDKYLEPKYAYVKTRVFTCDICNNFNAPNKQSLSAHKRGCKKKNASNDAT